MDGPSLPQPSRTPLDRHAIDFIAETVLSSEEPVTLVPTGPLTNIGLFLALHPDAAERVARIVLMGGAIGEGNVTPAAEFNIWADPEAADRVFSSGLEVTMVGLDVTHKALVGPAHAEQLRAAGRVGTMVAELLDFYGRFHRETYGWDGSPIHDAVALAHAFRPEILETVRTGVRVDCDGELGRGRTNCDLRGRMGWEPNATVAVDIDADGFVELLLERIASLG
jgi:inosine-uridine nucleoside N-ribohydrolase